MITPAVVLKSKFVMPTSNDYNQYVSYMDREDAKKELEVGDNPENQQDFNFYHSFMDYMNDDKKQGSLFTSDNNDLSKEETASIKDDFKTAQINGSPMWQDVISFDNAWLEAQGLYDFSTLELNENKMKNVVRSTMDSLFKYEKMEDSAMWTASFHYNTDNIHVHIATVEPYPTREKIKYYDKDEEEWKKEYKGKRKQGSLNRMKSNVANQILDRTKEFNKLDDLIRGTVHYKKGQNIQFATEEKTKELFFLAMDKLPRDLKQWQYGYHSVNEARPYIDEIVDIYLDNYHEDEMQELDRMLDEQVDVSKRLYGEGSEHEKYKDTKKEDLKRRMGNAVLSEMRSYKMEERKNNGYYSGKSTNRKNNFQKQQAQQTSEQNAIRRQAEMDRFRNRSKLHFAMIRMKVAMRKTYHEHQAERNIAEYDRMLDVGYERE